ncbi:MAG: DUF4194 domain-containing protein [Cyanobacteria bacterium P01_F01_bin.150]
MIESQPPQPYAPVIIKLLKGVMYSDDPHWDRLQSYLTPIEEYFSKIGMRVQNFDTDGFAYVDQPDPDEDAPASEVLPRLTARRSLSFKVTLLCVLLRDQLRQFDSSDATGRLVLNIETLRDLLQPYLPDTNNEEKFRRDVDSLVRQVTDLGFLRRLSGREANYEVRPIIKAKIDADMLERLKQKLEEYSNDKG